MLKSTDLLLGVKTTLKRLAVKLELAWQGLSDLDSINCRPPMLAFAPESRERMDMKVVRGERIEKRIMGYYVRRYAVAAWWKEVGVVPEVPILDRLVDVSGSC